MGSLLTRDFHLNDLLDRVDTLERSHNELLNYSFIPGDVSDVPEDPEAIDLAGWVVKGDRLQDKDGKIIFDPSVPRIQIASNGYIESANFVSGSAGFQINGGTAEFNDVVVRGTIYADAGEIGGWTINATTITGGNAELNSTGDITLGTGDDVAIMTASNPSFRMWIGKADSGTAPFRVSRTGSIKATAGTVGGWTLSSTSLTGGAATLHVNGYANFGLTNDIARLDASDATYRLWVGNATAGSAPFRVSKSGEVWATNGHFTGEIDANSGHLGSLDVDGVITVGASAPYIEIDGLNKRIRSSSYTANRAGFTIEDNGDAEFNNVDIRGALHTTVFIKDLISAHAGSLVVTKSAGKLAANCTIGTDNLVVDDPPTGGSLFDVDDVIQLKEEYASGILSTWLEIDTIVGGAGNNEYTYTKLSGDTVVYRKGTTAIDWGPNTGGGGVWMTADQTNAPYLSVFTHAGDPYSSGFTDRVVLGNLRNRADYGANDVYGIFVGDYSGDKWMAYDPTNSLRIHGQALIDGTLPGQALSDSFGAELFRQYGVFLLDFQKFKQSGSNWYLRLSRGELIPVTGAIRQEPGFFSGARALAIEPATTNDAENPSFETGTTADWTLTQGGTGGTIAASSDYGLDGDYSLKLTIGSDWTAGRCDQLITVPAGGFISISAWCKTWTAGKFVLYLYDTTNTTGRGTSTAHSGSGQWELLHHSWENDTGLPANVYAYCFANYSAGNPVAYYDNVNLEEKEFYTSYCDGDLGIGFSWSGAQDNSTSSRTQTKVTADSYAPIFSDQNKISIRILWRPFHDGNFVPSAGNVYFFEISKDGTLTDNIGLYWQAGTGKLVLYSNDGIVGTTTNVMDWAAYDYVDIVTTLDYLNDEYKIYVDGTLEGSFTPAKSAPTGLNRFSIGSDDAESTTSYPCGAYQEFAAFTGYILTQSDVSALHKLTTPIVDPLGLERPGLYVIDGQVYISSNLTGNRIILDGNELAGYDSSSVKQFYLQASDGKAYCAGGTVTLDDSGVHMGIATSYEDKRSLSFEISGTVKSQVRAYRDASTNIVSVWADDDGGRDSTAELWSSSFGSDLAIVKMRAIGETYPASFYIESNNSYAEANLDGCDLLVNNGGINTLYGVYVGDPTKTANIGELVLDLGSYDYYSVRMLSDDVTHEMTDYGSTNMWFSVGKAQDTSGGAQLRGYKDSDGGAGYALHLMGFLGENADTTKTTGAIGVITASSYVKSGTGVTGVNSDGNLFVIRTDGSARFIFDAEGSAHADVEWTTFDEHNDVAVLESLEHYALTNGDPIKEEFGEFLEYNKEALGRMGLAHFEDDTPGRAMVNFTRLSMLLTGAVKQLNGKMQRYEKALVELGVDPQLLTQGGP